MVSEGISLAILITKHNLNTLVQTECDSSCTIVFLGGHEKMLGPGAKLGFHQFSSPGIFFHSSSDDSALRYVYSNEEVPNEFIEKIITIPSSSIWYPTDKELLDAKMITRYNLKVEIIFKQPLKVKS